MKLFHLALAAIILFLPACRRSGEAQPETQHSRAEPFEHPTEIRLDDSMRRLLGIETARAERIRLALTIRASGRIVAQVQRMREIRTPFTSWVDRVLVELNQPVRPGQELAVLSSPDLPALRAELAKADSALATAQKSFDRLRRLTDIGAASQRELQEAQAQLDAARIERERALLRIRESGLDPENLQRGNPRLTLKSPDAGMVVERLANPGELVPANNPLFRLVNITMVDSVLDVYESELGAVRVGQVAEVRVPAYADRIFRGRITSIGAVLSEHNRTAQVRVSLNNPDHSLKPEMLCEGDILRGESREVVAVPVSAIVDDDGIPVVYVQAGDRYLRHPVQLGARTLTRIEIVSGINSGEMVVSKGGYQLKGMALNARPQGEHQD